MTSNHFTEVVQGLIRRTPFRPFTVELVGGRRFEVDHDRAVIERDGAAVFIAPGGVPHWFDHDSVNCIVEETASRSAE